MYAPWINRALNIGYNLTSNLDYCKIQLCKIFDCKILSASSVSKFIGFMVRTHANFLDYPLLEKQCGQGLASNNATSGGSENQVYISAKTWTPEIFIFAVKQLIPNLSWRDVYFGLDHDIFIIKNRADLEFLLNIARLASGHFPVNTMYRYWRNIAGQFSLVSEIFKNPDLYSFADNMTNIVTFEMLAVQPKMVNKDIAQWQCIDLIDVVMFFANNGYSEEVSDILKFPTQHCPDVLCLALIYINPTLTKFRKDFFGKLITIFFPNLPNSGKILQQAWNTKRYSNTYLLRPIILSALTEWYLSDESLTKLPRVLEIAVHLKALNIFLNLSSYEFVLDLACIASVTYYIDMENWLSEKLVDGGEPFVEALIIYLQCHSSHTADKNIVGSKMKKVFQLREETVSIILKSLENCIGLVNINLSYRIAEITGAQPTSPTVCPALEDLPPSVELIQNDLIPLSSNNEQQIFNATNAGGSSNPIGFLPGSSENVVALQSTSLSEPFSTYRSVPVMTNDEQNANNLTPSTSCGKTHEPLTLPEVSELVQSFSKEVEDEAIQRIYNSLLQPCDLEIVECIEDSSQTQQQLDLQQQQQEQSQKLQQEHQEQHQLQHQRHQVEYQYLLHYLNQGYQQNENKQ